MNKKLFLFLFAAFATLFTLEAATSDWLKNVSVSPKHANLNYNGELEIYYDLPDTDSVDEVYLVISTGSGDYTIEASGVDSGFATVNNLIKLSGLDFYNTLKNNRDLESDDKSALDGTYTVDLVVKLDGSSSGNDEKNDDDEENDDDDSGSSSSSSKPASVSKSLSILFDNKPPKAPSTIEIEGGNGSMLIRVAPPSTADGSKKEQIGKYHAIITGTFKHNGSEKEATLEFESEVDSDSYAKIWEFTVKGKDGYAFINNDENDPEKAYKVEVYAEDLAGNFDENATIALDASAVTTFGFWSNYASKGGKDDGGFCFVATACFGSYFHPAVELLRNFRDFFLSSFALGRSFIGAYYRYGSYPAEIIKGSPLLKSLSRTALMPLIAVAWFLTNPAGRIFGILWLSLVLFIILKPRRRGVAVLFVFFALLLGAGDLQAKSKKNSVHGEFSFTNSFYYPKEIDSEFSDGSPFKDVAGSEMRYLPSLTCGFAVPVAEKYIRWSFVGGIGYTRFKGRALQSDGTRTKDRTTMHFIPLMAETKLRPVYSFPLYPVVSIGIDYFTWWIREKGKTAQSGGTFGFHGTVGLKVSLNWIDPDSAKKMEDGGITDTALFVDYRFEKIDDFGKSTSFDLSDMSSHRFEFGIVFEF
ncbi:hypothetical protein J6Z39_07230 [bacterium]|nr:hypothetical protein [bacterium]